MTLVVVSDTSPIMNLAAIGRLDLLSGLFDRVIVPEAVAKELLAAGEDAPGAVRPEQFQWVQVRHVSDCTLLESLFLDLDEGEAQAIALATELNCNLLLMDERRGRMIAERLGITPLGLLGILVLAKRRGIIDLVRPILDKLITTAGFWLGAELYDQVLNEVSEKPSS